MLFLLFAILNIGNLSGFLPIIIIIILLVAAQSTSGGGFFEMFGVATIFGFSSRSPIKTGLKRYGSNKPRGQTAAKEYAKRAAGHTKGWIENRRNKKLEDMTDGMTPTQKDQFFNDMIEYYGAKSIKFRNRLKPHSPRVPLKWITQYKDPVTKKIDPKYIKSKFGIPGLSKVEFNKYYEPQTYLKENLTYREIAAYAAMVAARRTPPPPPPSPAGGVRMAVGAGTLAAASGATPPPPLPPTIAAGATPIPQPKQKIDINNLSIGSLYRLWYKRRSINYIKLDTKRKKLGFIPLRMQYGGDRLAKILTGIALRDSFGGLPDYKILGYKPLLLRNGIGIGIGKRSKISMTPEDVIAMCKYYNLPWDGNSRTKNATTLMMNLTIAQMNEYILKTKVEGGKLTEALADQQKMSDTDVIDACNHFKIPYYTDRERNITNLVMDTPTKELKSYLISKGFMDPTAKELGPVLSHAMTMTDAQLAAACAKFGVADTGDRNRNIQNLMKQASDPVLERWMRDNGIWT
jgi:hypothetical protein